MLFVNQGNEVSKGTVSSTLRYSNGKGLAIKDDRAEVLRIAFLVPIFISRCLRSQIKAQRVKKGVERCVITGFCYYLSLGICI